MVRRETSLIALRGLAASFVLTVVAFLCRVDNQYMGAVREHGLLSPFLISLLCGFAATCICLAVKPSTAPRSRLVWMVLATVAGVVGLVIPGVLFFAIAPETATSIGLACAIASGLLAGFGIAVALCQWLSSFAAFPASTILVTMSLTFFTTSIVWYVLEQVGGFLVLNVVLVVCMLASGLLFPFALSFGDSRASESPGSRDGSLQADENDVQSRVIREAVGRNLKKPLTAALIGLFFNFFTLGLTFFPDRAGVVGSIPAKPLAYGVIFVIAWLVLRKSTDPGRTVMSFSYFALPIAAAIVLVTPFVSPVIDLEANPLTSALAYSGVALFFIVGLALPLCVFRNNETRTLRCMALSLIGCLLAFGIGMLVFHFLTDIAQVVSLCVMAAYLAVFMVFTMRTSGELTDLQRQVDRNASEIEELEGAGGVDRRLKACEQITEAYGLSPREAEILQLLVRGYGASYVAKRLYISGDTVRTHAKRIYEKTGVHSKDELLELVERTEGLEPFENTLVEQGIRS